ncbi:MAG: Gfo/Idh/MocA family oxidoreductase [Armatimonadetes bacterium]|nr:Gfo/Idh/MocA family oxidoreductase [Armatimonadota bacterium]
MAQRIEFGIVGAGWRAEFYMRISQALPERFSIAGVVESDEAKRTPFGAKWGVQVYAGIAELLKETSPSFVVAAVGWPSTPGVLKELSDVGMPTLSETPPAPDLAGLRELGPLVEKKPRIQMAEQYWLQPHSQACAALIEKGLLGRPTYAHASVGHGYHGIGLLRRFLGVGLELPKISGKRFRAPIVAGGGRDGPPTSEQVRESGHDIIFFDWGDRLGVLDFTGDQYFGWIRNPRVLIRGERGEIVDDIAYYLKDFRTPMAIELRRDVTGAKGSLEGFYLRGIQAGGEWAYSNPFAPAPLSDDELAIATCLTKMDEYVRTGREFYSLAEGCQDHYLNLVSQEALDSGREIQAEPLG